jgi:hypothetical protein
VAFTRRAEPRQGFQEGTWPDLLAFAIGLGLAWGLQWDTTDLVWSLWLSSLVVGWGMIVWSIFGPMVYFGTKVWQDRNAIGTVPVGPVALGGAAALLGGLFLLAFFTVHFGGFHFVHSVFLQAFFPLQEGLKSPLEAGMETYFEVVRRYWVFLPAAFLAERTAFRFKPAPEAPPDTSVKAADIAARKKRNAQAGGMGGMMAPYKNVIRMHLLIFFFAAAHFARLDNLLVYAVVYAVYFFPWRIVRREKAAMAPAA